MTGLLDRVLNKVRTTASLPTKADERRLSTAEQEARAIRLRKELLDREVRATLERIRS